MSKTPSNPPPMPARHEIYIPGRSAAKLGLALLGVVLIILSLNKLGPVSKLAFAGKSARGEAVRIIRTDAAGLDAPAITSDAELLSVLKKVEDDRDYNSVFWVVYRFTAADGKTVEARAPLGQRTKPLQTLKDKDGLASTAVIWYDPANPTRIALPLELGTWFMPGMLVLFGVLAMYMGTVLWQNARKPIEMPDLSRSHGELNGAAAPHG